MTKRPNRNQERAEMLKRHKRWPLGTFVMVLTDNGYLEGKVFKHCGLSEFRPDRGHASKCIVQFDRPVTIDGGHPTFGQWVPFRSLKRIPEKSPVYGAKVVPWFMKDGFEKLRTRY